MALTFANGGCRSRDPGVTPKTYENLTKIGEAYLKATEKLNRGPAKIEEIMPYLKEMGDPAEILRSGDDKEEFVIFWGVDYRAYQAEGLPLPVTAMEKTGKNGKRNVLRVRFVFQLTDDELRQVPFPPGQKAPVEAGK